MQDFHHPWIPDDGLICLSWQDRESPRTPGVIIFDRATGSVVNQLDLTDLFLGGQLLGSVGRA